MIDILLKIQRRQLRVGDPLLLGICLLDLFVLMSQEEKRGHRSSRRGHHEVPTQQRPEA
ncbi:hypothetical protein D3C75_1388610 [compost metagenome]